MQTKSGHVHCEHGNGYLHWCISFLCMAASHWLSVMLRNHGPWCHSCQQAPKLGTPCGSVMIMLQCDLKWVLFTCYCRSILWFLFPILTFCSSPAATAVISLAFGRYILEPFFMQCEIPELAIKLITAVGISKYLILVVRKSKNDVNLKKKKVNQTLKR